MINKEYKKLTIRHFEVANKNGIRRALVITRVRDLWWDIKKAITEPVADIGSKTFTEEELELMEQHNVPETLAYQRIFYYIPKWDRHKAMTTPVKKKRATY